MDNNISLSKIVATPTLNSWSQVYNAGKLFAVLSLEKTHELSEETESLNMLGKDLLERLEQEFFVIEDKNLESIKKAISAAFVKGAEGVTTSFAAGALMGDILYLFCLGNAKVFLKRAGNFGLVLTSENIAASSGFLKDNDLIVLTTDAFAKEVTQDELNASLNDSEPTDIAESLAPRVHKAENGKISAIIIKYKKLRAGEMIDEGISEQEEEIQEVRTEKQTSPLNKFLSSLKSKFRKPNFKLQPTKKIFFAVTITIICILIFSVLFTIQKQNKAKVRALFAEIYPQAQKKYDEGQSLVDLNKNFARDAFTSAQKLLNDNKNKFPVKSKEFMQTQDLLKKIDDGLAQISPIDKSGLDRSKLSILVENGSGIEGVAGKAAKVFKDLGYNVPSTGNADNYNYTGVTIKVKKEDSKFLDLLKKDLAKEYTITATSSDLSPTSPTNALIIIGK